MPLTAKGREIKKALVKEYGEKHGTSVLYAGRNKGTFTGIDKLNKAMQAGATEMEAQKQAKALMEGKSVSGRDRAKAMRR